MITVETVAIFRITDDRVIFIESLLLLHILGQSSPSQINSQKGACGMHPIFSLAEPWISLFSSPLLEITASLIAERMLYGFFPYSPLKLSVSTSQTKAPLRL